MQALEIVNHRTSLVVDVTRKLHAAIQQRTREKVLEAMNHSPELRSAVVAMSKKENMLRIV